MKQVLVSGIQPTGALHLGNYLGALRHFVELQNSGKFECYFFIADLHSLTHEYAPKAKYAQILDIAADYLAAGLDPKKCVIFQQSCVSAHTELTWILNTLTPMGELERMTQFKDKSGDSDEQRTAGLFDYPVLMASDILLYHSSVVPVGHDQLQHLELTRTLARKFNAKFGKTFIEPKPKMTNVERLMSLDDPTKKMSKSRPAGCVFVDDTDEVIRKKIMSAVTDSERTIAYDKERRPAIANLLELYAAVSGKEVAVIVKAYEGKGYADFKKDLAEAVIASLSEFKKRKKALKKNIAEVINALQKGNKKAATTANKTMEVVRKKIGIVGK